MTVYTDKRKGIAAPGSNAFNEQMREAVQTYLGMQGNPLNRGITVGDLAAAGLIDVSSSFLSGQSRNPISGVNTVLIPGGGGGTVIIGGDTYEPDLTPPPTPSGFAATGAIASVIVECGNPTYTEGHGHGVTVLYGAKYSGTGSLPTFSNAVPLATFQGTAYGYPTEPSTTWRLWIKWMSRDGIESASPAGGTNGLEVKTGANVSNLLDALSEAARDAASPYTQIAWRADMFYITSLGNLPGDPLFTVVTTPLTIGGVSVPTGMYVRDGFIMNGTITNAKIANLAVDDAKISALSVGKLTAGSLQVGAFIQSSNYVAGTSGFRINAAGTAEFNSITVRGTGFFGNGTVGGIQIGATYVQSSNYDGAGNGFRLESNGNLFLPGGSVSASMLNIGAGANLLANSAWVDFQTPQPNALPMGWEFATNEPTAQRYVSAETFPDWVPPGMGGWAFRTTTPTAGGVAYASGRIPVVGGKRYEFSVYCGAHRCQIYTDFLFFDGYGNIVGNFSDNGVQNNQEQAGGRALTNFKRIGCFGVAPATAAYAFVRFIKLTTLAGSDSYGFFVAPMVCEAQPKQTAFSPYSPSGIGTRISPQGISTPSLQALTGVMGDLYAGSVRGGSMPGYQWPTDGGGGFYLGPPGLILGNANLGKYFQVSAEGNIYMPGMRVENGTLFFTQANAVDSNNIVIGAVTIGLQATGTNRADVFINVTAGETWYLSLTAVFGQSNQFPPAIYPQAATTVQTLSLTGALGNLTNNTAGGGLVYFPAASLSSVFALGGGLHQLTALASYDNFAYYTAPVQLIGFAFKR